MRKVTKKSLDALAQVMPVMSEEEQQRYIGGAGGCIYGSNCYTQSEFNVLIGSGAWDGGCVIYGDGDHIYTEKIDDIIVRPNSPEVIHYYTLYEPLDGTSGMWVYNPSGSCDDFCGPDPFADHNPGTGESTGGGGSGGGDTGDGGSTGGGGAINPPPYSEKIHHEIITDALADIIKDKAKLEAVKAGSNYADSDKFQDKKFNHMHALRSSDETVTEAVDKMRTYFVEHAEKYLKNGNFNELGQALHPIMDAYAEAHMGFQEYDGLLDIGSHYKDWFRDNADNAVDAVENIMTALDGAKTTADVTKVFNGWMISYCEFLKEEDK